jgi:hypothetical protein
LSPGVALDQVVDFGVEFIQRDLGLVLHLARARLVGDVQLHRLAHRQLQRRLAQALDCVGRQLQRRQIHALALAAESQQQVQQSEEDGALLDGGVAVVEELRQEAVSAHVGRDVALEHDQRVHRVLCGLGPLGIFAGRLERLFRIGVGPVAAGWPPA